MKMRHTKDIFAHLKQWLHTPSAKLLLVAVVWQTLLTIVGTIFAARTGDASFFANLSQHALKWDAGWYLHIIDQGYGLEGSPAAPAFYPLFPLVISLLSAITFYSIPVFVLSILFNTVCVWLILVALRKILQHFKLSNQAIIFTLALFLAFPSAFFMHVFYSEALFIALAFWGYLFALKGRWWAVGIVLAALTATRLPSLLFLGLYGLEYLRSYQWNIKKAFNKNALWFLLAPVGFIGYALYLLITRGDAFAMFSAYSATNDWTYHHFNPNVISTLYESTATLITSVASGTFAYNEFVNIFLPLVAIIALLFSAGVLFAQKNSKYIPLALFGIVSAIFFSLNGNIVSVHRYVLPCILIFVVIALLYTKRRLIILLPLLLGSVALQLFLYMKFATNIFAG